MESSGSSYQDKPPSLHSSMHSSLCDPLSVSLFPEYDSLYVRDPLCMSPPPSRLFQPTSFSYSDTPGRCFPPLSEPLDAYSLVSYHDDAHHPNSPPYPHTLRLSPRLSHRYLSPSPPMPSHPVSRDSLAFPSRGNQHSPTVSASCGSAAVHSSQRKDTSKRSQKKAEGNGQAMPPGESNPNAQPGAKLCFEFMNTGVSPLWNCVTCRCSRMSSGGVCRYRHLSPQHPDAIADRYNSGLLSEQDIQQYKLRPCEEFETNPFAPIDAPICFSYLNRGVCSRTHEMRICRYRHLLPEHPDAIRDRLKYHLMQ